MRTTPASIWTRWWNEQKESFDREVSNTATNLMENIGSVLSNGADDDRIRDGLRRHVGDYAHHSVLDSRLGDYAVSTMLWLGGLSYLVGLVWTFEASRQHSNGELLPGIIAALIVLLSVAILVLIVAVAERLRTWRSPVSISIALLLGLAAFASIPEILLRWGGSYSVAARLLKAISIGTFALGIMLAWFAFLASITLFSRSALSQSLDRHNPRSKLLFSLGIALWTISRNVRKPTELDAEAQNSHLDYYIRHNADLASIYIGAIQIGGLAPEDIKTETTRHFIENCVRFLRDLEQSLGEALNPIAHRRDPGPYADILAAKLALHVGVEKKMRTLMSTLKGLANDLAKWDLGVADSMLERLERSDLSARESLLNRLAKCRDAIEALGCALTETGGKFVVAEASVSEVDLRLQHLKTRAEILANLEEAARSLEAMPAHFPPDDPIHMIWTPNVYGERADAIRDLKKWVLLPLDCTPHDLEAKIRAILLLLVAGNWGALDRVQVPKLAPLPWWERVWYVARPLLIAILPPSLVVGIQWQHIQLPAPLDSWALPISLVWTAMCLLAALDPHFAEKISTFKDLPSIFTRGSKEGKDSK